jgi:hypothetical protein
MVCSHLRHAPRVLPTCSQVAYTRPPEAPFVPLIMPGSTTFFTRTTQVRF